MSDYRVHLEDANGEFIPAGILFNPDKEELKRVNKKEELTPKQKKFVSEKLFKEGDDKAMFEHGSGGYINMYYVKNEILFNNLNIEASNVSRILYLATYIDWNTSNENLLVKPGQFNKSYPMTRRDLQLVLGLAERTFTDFIKSSKENNIMFEVDGRFYMNSDYFNKGKVSFKDKEYTRLYINTVRDLFERCNPRQHKQLSYLFKLIPKMYYLNNALVHNPEAKDLKDVKYMNLTDVCKFLGVGYDNNNMSKVKRDLIKFYTTYDGTKRGVFKYITVEGIKDKYSYFVVNPSVVYSGDDFGVANNILKLCYFNDEK